MRLHTQLNFGGNCEEAFRFYEKHLGGKVTVMMHQREAPAHDKTPPGLGNAIIHARMILGETELIGNDVPPDIFKPMRSAYLFLSLDSLEEAERAHHLLAEGGEIFMPLEETFFAYRFSMLRDRFGILWTIIHQRPMQQPSQSR
jgi:PhnB protein